LIFDKELKKHDKAVVLEELKSVTLMIWHDGSSGVPRGYDHITSERPKEDLEGWSASTLHLKEYKLARTTTLAAGSASMRALLEQLRGLYAHAGSAGI
jgi:hypothetical protein